MLDLTAGAAALTVPAYLRATLVILAVCFGAIAAGYLAMMLTTRREPRQPDPIVYGRLPDDRVQVIRQLQLGPYVPPAPVAVAAEEYRGRHRRSGFYDTADWIAGPAELEYRAAHRELEDTGAYVLDDGLFVRAGDRR